jgi:hypothetical protein
LSIHRTGYDIPQFFVRVYWREQVLEGFRGSCSNWRWILKMPSGFSWRIFWYVGLEIRPGSGLLLGRTGVLQRVRRWHKCVGQLGNKGDTFPKSNFPQTSCHIY